MYRRGSDEQLTASVPLGSGAPERQAATQPRSGHARLGGRPAATADEVLSRTLLARLASELLGVCRGCS